MQTSSSRGDVAALVAGIIGFGLVVAFALDGCGSLKSAAPERDGAAGSAGAAAGLGGSTAGGGGAAPVGGAAGLAGARADASPETAPALDGGRRDADAPADGPTERAADANVVVAEPTCAWPTPTADQMVTTTIVVAKTYDGGGKRFIGAGALGTSNQSESQAPIFELLAGATLRNAILGNPSADGVHCQGTCRLENVWWEDVGEDAATLKGNSPSQVMTVEGGGARHAADKVFQHNGPGTMIVEDFCVEDFGKLYRSCGNCTSQYARHAVFRNISATLPGKVLAGVNENYDDTASFSGIFVHGGSVTICQRFTGNNTGAEPTATGTGPDGTTCIYGKSDVVLR